MSDAGNPIFVFNEGDVPPSSMETIAGTVIDEGGGCLTLTETSQKYVLLFQSGTERTRRDSVTTFGAALPVGGKVKLTGSTLGPPNGSFRTRYDVPAECKADHVFLVNGVLD